jgi:hypothetical protein
MKSTEVQEKMGKLYFIILKQFYKVEALSSPRKIPKTKEADPETELPHILENLSSIITAYMVDTYQEDFVVYLRTESESLALDNLYQFFCCEKLDAILASKYVSVLTEEEQIIDLFYRFLNVVLDKILETIDTEVEIAEF